jgi:hypothetical protein
MPRASGPSDGASTALVDADLGLAKTRMRFQLRGQLKRARSHFAQAMAELTGESE